MTYSTAPFSPTIQLIAAACAVRRLAIAAATSEDEMGALVVAEEADVHAMAGLCARDLRALKLKAHTLEAVCSGVGMSLGEEALGRSILADIGRL